MATTNPEFTKFAALRYMRSVAWDHVDPTTDEVNCTSLAEACAGHFDVKNIGGPLDDETHWIWDIAVDVANNLK